jgi:hypothetical protein
LLRNSPYMAPLAHAAVKPFLPPMIDTGSSRVFQLGCALAAGPPQKCRAPFKPCTLIVNNNRQAPCSIIRHADDARHQTQMSPKKSEQESPLDEESTVSVMSLPVVEAQPEVSRLHSVTMFSTAVESLTRADRGNAQGWKRPGLISVRILKETVDAKLGVGFRSPVGELIINSISPTSPLTNSPIQAGDRLISLDHHQNVNHWSAAQAANYLRSRTGLITIIVETKNGDANSAEACVYKPTADMKVGLSFDSDQDRLRIKSVFTSDLLGSMSAIQPGDFVESINSMPVQEMDPTLAHELIRKAVGFVSVRVIKRSEATQVSVRDLLSSQNLGSRRLSETLLVADELDVIESGRLIGEDPIFPKPGLISVSVHKSTEDTRLGISFSNPTGCELIISSIADQSLMSKSPLAAGFVVHSINNIPCREFTKQQALDLIKSRTGEIRLMAQDRTGNANYAVGMAYKPTPRASLGLAFRSGGGSLSLSNIRADGLFLNSVLNSGDKVIAINRIPCEHMQPSEAVALTQKNLEKITILVRLSGASGIVLSHGAGPGGTTSTNSSPAATNADDCVASTVCCCILRGLFL